MIWRGHVSFGLVSIPVGLYPAESANALDFTLLDTKDHSPIGYRKVNKSTGAEVPASRIARGFEYAKGRYVIVTDEDLRRASPERTQRIDILSFTDQSEIDPRYFERPYYLSPSVAKNDKGYVLLREALKKTGKVGVATVVIRARQHLAALFPCDGALVLNTIRYPSELRDATELGLPGQNAHDLGVTTKEVDMAERLISDMVEPWRPEKYRDEYQEELLGFVRRRAKEGDVEEAEPEAPPPRKAPGNVVDIMELLKQSLDRAPKAKPASRRAKRRSA